MVNSIELKDKEIKSNDQIYEEFEQSTFHNYEQIASYYADEIELIPELDIKLKDYIYWSSIRRNVIQSFDEDDPVKLKKMIGTTVNDILMTDEIYQNAVFVYDNYNKAYDGVKKILKHLSTHYSQYVRAKAKKIK